VLKGMVDITRKDDVYREAVVEGVIKLKEETVQRILKGNVEKGDVLTSARLAAILAAKKTPELIPLCHPVNITNVQVDFEIKKDLVKVRSIVKSIGKTGVEMEALTATTIALLTIWDMVKKYEKDPNGSYPYSEIKSVKVIVKRKGVINNDTAEN